MVNEVETLRKELEAAQKEINRLTNQVRTLQAGSNQPPIIGQDLFDALRACLKSSYLSRARRLVIR